jgi:hypothetical protein
MPGIWYSKGYRFGILNNQKSLVGSMGFCRSLNAGTLAFDLRNAGLVMPE